MENLVPVLLKDTKDGIQNELLMFFVLAPLKSRTNINKNVIIFLDLRSFFFKEFSLNFPDLTNAAYEDSKTVVLGFANSVSKKNIIELFCLIPNGFI